MEAEIAAEAANLRAVERARKYIGSRTRLAVRQSAVQLHHQEGEALSAIGDSLINLGHRAVLAWQGSSMIRAYNASGVFLQPREQGVLALAYTIVANEDQFKARTLPETARSL